jgi:hypothetical protein
LGELSLALSVIFRDLLSVATGSKNTQAHIEALGQAERDIMDQRSRLEGSIISTAQEEVEISKLRLAGKEKEADLLERQAKLRRDLKSIEQSGLTDAGKTKLRDATFRKYEIDRVEIERKDKERIKETEKKEGADTRSANLANQEAEAARLRLAGREAEAAAMERQIQLARELAAIEASSMSDSNKQLSREAAQKKANIAEDTAQKEEQDKAQKQAASREELGVQLAILEAKARGRDKEAQALQNALSLNQRIAELTDGPLGLSTQEAEAVAKREQEAKERIDEDSGSPRSGRRRGKIRGGNNAISAAALNEWRSSMQANMDQLNERRGVEPRSAGQGAYRDGRYGPKGPEDLWEKVKAGRATAQSQAARAGATKASGSTDSILGQILSKLNNAFD